MKQHQFHNTVICLKVLKISESNPIFACLFGTPAVDHSGVGPTHIRNFMTAVYIPPANEGTIRQREREISPVIEAVAKNSCKAAAEEEVKATPSDTGITISYDMGWQKRGRAMNSSTGVGHAVGARTGKVIEYATRSERCAICYAAEQRNVVLRKHDCRRNHSKSSKAMEADAVEDIASDLQQAGITVSRMVGDDDSSAIKRLREQMGTQVKKSSDLNHVKKNLATCMI